MILPVVLDIDAVGRLNGDMEALGYEPTGEFGLPGRRYFRRGVERRTHNVHVYAAGKPETDRHLAFRDYLRAHPGVAGEIVTRVIRPAMPADLAAMLP